MCEARDVSRRSKNEQQKLSSNTNGHNLSLGCAIHAHNISRRSKLNTEALYKFKRPKLLTQAYAWNPLYVDTLEMNNESYREIQMVNTFHSLVQFWRIIYWDGRSWTRKPLANSIGHNFWLGCMFEAQDILRRSKMNSRSSRHIEMVIIYQDTRNWISKLSGNWGPWYIETPEKWTTKPL